MFEYASYWEFEALIIFMNWITKFAIFFIYNNDINWDVSQKKILKLLSVSIYDLSVNLTNSSFYSK